MSPSSNRTTRAQSTGEETANSISHGIGFVAALAGMPFLLMQAIKQGEAKVVVAMLLFSVSMITLYLASTLYHALPDGKAKRVFRTIEHSAIYLLIAGTYTPFTLGILRGAWGWTLFGTVWTIAAIGIALKALGKATHPVLSTSLYLLLGWLIVVAAVPMSKNMAPAGLLLVIAGGLSYSVGVVFFAMDSRLRYGHFIWHLFVIAGSACHYFAVLWHSI